MRTIVTAVVLALALVGSSRSAIADESSAQVQAQALEAQIAQLVDRVCALEATIERLRQQGCAVDMRPATAAEPEPEPAKPDPWCSTIDGPNTH